jgi:hypothetical protein
MILKKIYSLLTRRRTNVIVQASEVDLAGRVSTLYFDHLNDAEKSELAALWGRVEAGKQADLSIDQLIRLRDLLRQGRGESMNVLDR